MGKGSACGTKRRCSGSGLFWIGAGIGTFLSAAAVVIAAEFTHRRRQRLLTTGSIHLADGDFVHDLSEAVHDGLETLTSAIGSTFSEARRELVRLGLDPLLHGGDSADAGVYYEEPAPREPSTSSFSDDWDDAAKTA